MQNIYIYPVIIWLIVFQGNLFGQAGKILKQSEQAYLEKQNGHYAFTMLFKSLSGPDTFSSSFEVYFRRNIEDKFIDPDYFVIMDSANLVYNQKGWIAIDHREKHFYNKKEPIRGNSSWRVNKEELPIINPSHFFSSIKPSLRNSVTENESYFIVNNGYKSFYVRKKDYLIDKIEERIEDNDSIQYFGYIIHYQDFDDEKFTNDKYYNESAIPDNYAKTSYEEVMAKYRRTLLDIGTRPSNWSFPTPNGDTISLSDFRGKYVILDFWYQSCFPCIKSLPSLQQIYDTYKDKNLVLIGINPYDKDADRLVKFINNNEITYPIAMAYGSDIQEKYQISAYPTYYILDPEGKIIYVQEGYDSNQKRKIKTLLDKLIH